MKYAIIAAGEGSRLVQEGVAAPKPLVKVGGEMLIDRLIRVFMDNNASEICVICNEQMTAVAEHLKQISEAGRVPLKYTVKSTPSSMHSMWELSKWLGDEPFILTTVDTIFRENEFKVYANTFQLFAAEGVVDGLMGVTDYIDDEKPLYVGTSQASSIPATILNSSVAVSMVSHLRVSTLCADALSAATVGCATSSVHW